MKARRQQIQSTQSTVLRVLLLSAFFTLGVTTAGGLAMLTFNGWIGGIAAVLGGVWGIFIAALCQATGAEVSPSFHHAILINNLNPMRRQSEPAGAQRINTSPKHFSLNRGEG